MTKYCQARPRTGTDSRKLRFTADELKTFVQLEFRLFQKFVHMKHCDECDHRRSLLVTDDSVEMETLLRANGSFMEFMKDHLPDEEKAHHMRLIQTFAAAERAENSTRSTAQPQPADQASCVSTVGHG